MNEEHLKMFNNLSEFSQKLVIKEMELRNRIEETKNRLMTEPEIQKYFDDFHPYYLESFIDHYAYAKENLLTQGPSYVRNNFNHEYQFMLLGTEALRAILLKKLLLKMCEWSAGLIELEEIETSDDFVLWQDNNFNCPFLEPVTTEELKIYKQYYNSSNYRYYDSIHIDSTYWLVKRDYEKNDFSNSEEPEFSIIYDTIMGTTDRWLLPNIKIAKEDFYKSIYHKERMRKYYKDIEDGIIKAPGTDKRAKIDTNDNKLMEESIKKFESPQLLDYFRNKLKFMDDSFIQGDNGLVEIMPDANQIRMQTIEAFDIVLEDYLFRKQSGLSFEVNEEHLKNLKEVDIPLKKNQIIEGRKLLGEPDNLDIY